MSAVHLRIPSLRTFPSLVAVLFLLQFGVLDAANGRKAASFEESSFVQNRVVMRSGVRKVEPLSADEELEDDLSSADDDNPSLMQAEVCTKKSKTRLQPLNEEDIDDEVSMMQTDIALHQQDDFGIEEEEEEFSAMQTSVTMMVSERHVGTGRPYGEDDTFDGASFMQNEATFIRKSDRTDENCANGQVDDEDATDEVSLMQTDVVLNRADSEGEDEYGIEEEEEFSAMQTSVTMMVGERHVGTGRPYGEDDTFDGASFMQNEATFIRKSDRTDENCANGQVDDEDATDEVSLMQTDVVLNRVDSEGEDEYGIEEEEEFSAMQTSVTMMVDERHVGTGRPYGEDDTFDGASFMQNEATFIRKSDRTDENCANGQADDEDATDEVSLMQTDVVLNRAEAELEENYGIEEDEEEEFSAMQTSVTMMVGERHVGTGRRYGEEDDTFDGASFMQNEATFIRKKERTDTSCTNGEADEEDVSDEVSL